MPMARCTITDAMREQTMHMKVFATAREERASVCDASTGKKNIAKMSDIMACVLLS